MRVFDESNDRLCVDRFSFHHGVGDASQLDNFWGDRVGGLLKGLEDIDDAENLVADRIGEFDHGKFDHLVAGDVKTGRFDAERSAIAGGDVIGAR